MRTSTFCLAATAMGIAMHACGYPEYSFDYEQEQEQEQGTNNRAGASAAGNSAGSTQRETGGTGGTEGDVIVGAGGENPGALDAGSPGVTGGDAG